MAISLRSGKEVMTGEGTRNGIKETTERKTQTNDDEPKESKKRQMEQRAQQERSPEPNSKKYKTRLPFPQRLKKLNNQQ